MDGTKIYTSIVVTNVIRAGSAFALRADNGEQCFVPWSIVEAIGLVAGTEAEALLLPNMAEDKKGKTPWFTAHVDPASIVRPEMKRGIATPSEVRCRDATPSAAKCLEAKARPEEANCAEVQLDLDWNAQVEGDRQRVKQAVRHCLMVKGGVWSHGQLVESAWGQDEEPPKWVRNCVGKTLRSMHRDGEIARWAFYRRGEQERASRDYWCATPDQVELVLSCGQERGA